MSNDNHIEQFFKKHLDVEADGFLEDDWAKMEQKLDAAGIGVPSASGGLTAGKVIALVSVVATVAFLLGWYLSPKGSGEQGVLTENKQVIIQSDSSGTEVSPVKPISPVAGNDLEEIDADQSVEEAVVSSTSRVNTEKNVLGANSESSEDKLSESAPATRSVIPSTKTISINELAANETVSAKKSAAGEQSQGYHTYSIERRSASLGMINLPPTSIQEMESGNPEQKESFIAVVDLDGEKDQIQEENIDSEKRPKLFVGLAYAPDMNGASFFGEKTYSNKAGVRFFYRPFGGWSIGTGLFYNRKKYGVEGEAYTPPPGYWDNANNGIIPDWIVGSCGVIDIPITLTFQKTIGQRFDAVMSIGASYFVLLDEEYLYETSRSSYYGNTNGWSTEENTKEGFAAYNLSVGVDYHLRKERQLRLEAYVKNPIEKIGWGNVALYGNGVMITYFNPIRIFKSK